MATAPARKCRGHSGALPRGPEALPEASAAAASVHELFRMPQQSTMLRIISNICGEGAGRRSAPETPGSGQVSQLSETRCWGGVPKQSQSRPTHHDHSNHDGRDADDYSFPRKSSSIFPWQSSCRGGQGAVRGCPSSTHEAAARGPMKGTAPPPGPPKRGVNSEACQGTLRAQRPRALSGQELARETRAPSTRGLEVTTAPR